MLKDKIQAALAPLNLAQVSDGDYAKTGYHLEVAAAPGQMPAVAQAMLDAGCFLESLTAVDLRESFTLVYHFASFDELCRTVVHASLAKEKRPRRPSRPPSPGCIRARIGTNGRSTIFSASSSPDTPT